MECGCRTIVHIYNYVESKVNTCKLRGVTKWEGWIIRRVDDVLCSWYEDGKRDIARRRRKREREREEKKEKERRRKIMEGRKEETTGERARRKMKNEHTGTYTHTDRSTSTHTS